MLSWRKFQFFQKELIKDDSGVPFTLSDDESGRPTCSSSGLNSLVFGDSSGFIHMVDRDYRITKFRAHDTNVCFIQQTKDPLRPILVTVGNDDCSSPPSIKFFDIGDIPTLIMSVKPFNSRFPEHAITAFAALNDLTQMCLGLSNGTIILFSALDLTRTETPRQEILNRDKLSESSDAITNVVFREGPHPYLFVTTLNSVVSFATKAKTITMNLLEEEEGGCAPRCACINDEKQLITGPEQATYFYEVDEKGPCFGFEGVKKQLSWFNSYLVVVTEDAPAPNAAGSEMQFNTINIYDRKNKFIAFQHKFIHSVVDVVAEWGSLFVLSNNELWKLTEKDLHTKMEILFNTKQFSIAISLAGSHKCDKSYVMDIFQMYGDHLYDKGDYDGAISQYVHTIGSVEPSYVIRKFLDAQRIYNLTRYLQSLHEKNFANTDHTTLLLNCYTKLKDARKLDEFIKGDSAFHFDVETVILVCRQAQYFSHALHLAKVHSYHDLHLKILVDDMKDFETALDHLSTLDFSSCNQYMKKYGKKLIAELPDATTALLVKLCTDYISPSQDASALQQANPDNFLHIFVNHPHYLQRFIEQVLAYSSNASTSLFNTLLELYLKPPDTDIVMSPDDSSKIQKARKNQEERVMDLLRNPTSKYDTSQALILCQMYGFQAGILYLYEKLGLFYEILQFYASQRDVSNVIATCHRFGHADGNLWAHALSFCASVGADQEVIETVINNIEKQHMLPPLMVIQILAKNPDIPLSVVSDYIVRNLESEVAQIDSDKAVISQYQTETQKMRAEISDIKNRPRTFKNSSCEACTAPLDLPTVHFLCMHSYHQRCLGDSTSECPRCAPEFRKLLEMKESMKKTTHQHDKFMNQLDSDGFSILAEHFGRGLFNKT